MLLEVQASLRYFGGLERLLQRLDEAVRPLGHAVRVARAATAQGAALLARLQPPPHCGADLARTRRALAGVPVWLLGPGREHWEALQGMGLRQLGDLLGLPRAGLARRFGEGLLLDLDAALGRRPDPREPIVLAPAFESRLELFARADSTEQVLHGAGVLIERLVAWLSAQHAFVRRFRLLMQHEPRWQSARTPPATALEIALAEPSRDSAHLLVLLRERLAQVQLPAPTLELALQADDITRRAAPNSELFPTAAERERGPDAAGRAPAGAPRRRPGAAPGRRAKTTGRSGPAPCVRPTRTGRPAAGAKRGRRGQWPCQDPRQPHRRRRRRAQRRLRTASRCGARSGWKRFPSRWRRGGPGRLLDGRPLRLLCGPERIEAGWWDAGLAERDYFIGEAADGALVWIYRARLPLSATRATKPAGLVPARPLRLKWPGLQDSV